MQRAETFRVALATFLVTTFSFERFSWGGGGGEEGGWREITARADWFGGGAGLRLPLSLPTAPFKKVDKSNSLADTLSSFPSAKSAWQLPPLSSQQSCGWVNHLEISQPPAFFPSRLEGREILPNSAPDYSSPFRPLSSRHRQGREPFGNGIYTINCICIFNTVS